MTDVRVGVQLQAEDGEAGTELKSLLKHTAEVYRTLLGNAQKAGIAVPPEALLGAPGTAGKAVPRWNDFAALEAEDWEDFEDEGTHPHIKHLAHRSMKLPHHCSNRIWALWLLHVPHCYLNA